MMIHYSELKVGQYFRFSGGSRYHYCQKDESGYFCSQLGLSCSDPAIHPFVYLIAKPWEE